MSLRQSSTLEAPPDSEPFYSMRANVVPTAVSSSTPSRPESPAILHVCKRDMLRPLRDQILRVSGYKVDSTLSETEALSMFKKQPYSLILIDVEGERGVPEAEHLCSEIKTARKDQLVAFVCNWRVAVLTDCPDDIVRTEFDPAAFVAGVNKTLGKA
jgi:DNA-binding response OmpR family regulator